MRHSTSNSISPKSLPGRTALRRLIRRQIEAGIDFLVPCGTTGENPTLTRAEHLRVVEITVEESQRPSPSPGRRRRLQHQRSNRTSQRPRIPPRRRHPLRHPLLQQAHARRSLPTLQSDRRRHLHPHNRVQRPRSHRRKRRAGHASKRLAKIENIAGVKEASGNIGQIATIISQAPENFSVLSGDDAIALPVIALGGHGVISVAANEIPAEMGALIHACLDNNFTRARELQKQLSPADGNEFHRIQSRPRQSCHGRNGPARTGLAPPARVTESSKICEKIRGVLESTGLVGKVHAAAGN